jgi:hypothetical protein
VTTFTRSRALRAAVFTAVLCCALSGSQSSGATQRRFALIIGNDVGGDDTRPLLYATADARRIHRVLVELGNVPASDATLLVNRTAPEVMSALGELERRAVEARRHGERTTFIVYYSGHAKDGALRLGPTRLVLDELKTRLQRSAADVLIGVFDSCRSGVVTRTKGARHAPAFDVQTGSEEAKGTVFLTSSSADEDAQESDDIRGSYFSYYLESGLRGGADRSNDGRITLAEAYDYAYARTVADTAASAAGAQHPTYSYDLKGNGDVVLTDYKQSAGLQIPPAAPAGTYYIVRGDFITAEVVKPAGETRRIALPADKYWVKRRLVDRIRIGKVEIPEGQVVTLNEAGLRDAPFSDDPVKGATIHRGPSYSIGLAGTFQSFFDAPTRDGLFPPASMLGAELHVRDFFRKGWVLGVDLAAGGTRSVLFRPGGVTLPFRFGELALGASLFTEWSFLEDRISPFLGARLAFVFMNRVFDDMGIPQQSFSTFSPGLVGGVRYRIGSGFAVLARLRVHYLLYNVDENRSLGYWELATMLAYEF